MSSYLATDYNGLLFWLNVSFVVNHRWTCWPIMDIAMDLFISEDRYFLQVAAVTSTTFSTTFVKARVRIAVTHASRRSPNLRPGSDQRYSTALTTRWTHYVIQWLYSRPDLPALLVKPNYNRFNHHERPVLFFSIGNRQEPTIFLVVTRWLCDEFSIPPAPEHMLHKVFITFHFYIST